MVQGFFLVGTATMELHDYILHLFNDLLCGDYECVVMATVLLDRLRSTVDFTLQYANVYKTFLTWYVVFVVVLYSPSVYTST